MYKKDVNNNFDTKDIINSEWWWEEEWKRFFQQRLSDMRAGRSEYDVLFDKYDKQIVSKSKWDEEGQLEINRPLEKVLIEIEIGRTDGKLTYDIIPDGQADIEQLQPSKFAMMFFLDWEGDKNFWKENDALKYERAKYGSAIMYTWIRDFTHFDYIPKKDIEDNTDIFNEKNFDKIKKNKWLFFPQKIDIRNFWIDENALGQKNIQEADDCIMKETMSATEFYLKFSNKPNINQELLKEVKYSNDSQSSDGMYQKNRVSIYYYFNRLMRKFIIVVNEKYVIYNGIFLYDDGKLPFVNFQYYTKDNKFYGEGIPERVWYLKTYQSELLNDILVWASMSNSLNFVVWNDNKIWNDWNFWGRGVNYWTTNGWVENIKNMQPNINLWYFQNVMSILDDLTIIDSGSNPRETFDPLTDKVGIRQILEANKNIRHRSTEKNYNIWLDEALTMMLSRIKQFASKLLLTTTKKDDKIVWITYFKIRLEDYKVVKKNGKTIIEEDMWKYGYFELKNDTIKWIWVKVVTPSTNNVMKVVEREKITQFVNNLNILFNIAQADPTGETSKKILKFMNIEDLIWRMSDYYDYDLNWLKANSSKDDIIKENLKKIEELKKVLTINQLQNEQWQWEQVQWMWALEWVTGSKEEI